MPNRPLTRSEKLLIILLAVGIIAVVINWDGIKKGFIKGWKHYSIEKWYDNQ